MNEQGVSRSSVEKRAPMISVIMGAFNCETTIRQAMQSIWNQTVTDWEVIVCDDGSNDATYSILDELQRSDPERMVLLRNTENKGLNFTLNKCLSYASGEFIARMDGDDLCSPNRFERELAEFENEPELSIVSSDMALFDENGTWGRISHREYPERKDFVKGTPFCHAPCLVRKAAFDAVNGYTDDPKLIRVEDYHLWIKMYKLGYKGKNIPEPLYQMRDDRDARNRRKLKTRINESYVIMLAIKELKLPVVNYVYCLRPIIVGLLPKHLYDLLHRKKLKDVRPA